MIGEVVGVKTIRMLYIQLMYRCNFSCQHCFHGELLKANDSYPPAEVVDMLRHFRTNYDLAAVTFLGGEPLLYPAIVDVCRGAKTLDLDVEICTNGHSGFMRQFESVAPYLDKVRISLEGLEATNDRIRQRGSFKSAAQTIKVARQHGIAVGATMTVTAANLDEVVPLAQLLEQLGVQELKLHCLRSVGNAIQHPELLITDTAEYLRLHEQIRAADLQIEMRYDSDLSPQSNDDACLSPEATQSQYLDRIEVDPRGAFTMSCKAVGMHASAFRWDPSEQTVIYAPHAQDELVHHIPDVVYKTA